MASTLQRDLANLLSASQVSCAVSVLEEHSSDNWFASATPDSVVFPQTTAEVSAVMAYASQHHLPVTARGSGVGYVGGCVPQQGGIVLSLARMKIRKPGFAAMNTC